MPTAELKPGPAKTLVVRISPTTRQAMNRPGSRVPRSSGCRLFYDPGQQVSNTRPQTLKPASAPPKSWLPMTTNSASLPTKPVSAPKTSKPKSLSLSLRWAKTVPSSKAPTVPGPSKSPSPNQTLSSIHRCRRRLPGWIFIRILATMAVARVRPTGCRYRIVRHRASRHPDAAIQRGNSRPLPRNI